MSVRSVALAGAPSPFDNDRRGIAGATGYRFTGQRPWALERPPRGMCRVCGKPVERTGRRGPLPLQHPACCDRLSELGLGKGAVKQAELRARWVAAGRRAP